MINIEAKLQEHNQYLSKLIHSSIDRDFPMAEAMIYSLLGKGKRIRSVIFNETLLMLGGERRLIDNVALAIEFVHTYSLIHDDLPAMDNAEMRRGQASCHRKFDEATAILAGDALLTEAFLRISHYHPQSSDYRVKLVTELVRAIGYQGMVGGQMLDMRAQEFINDQEKIIYMQELKTGRLFTYCCVAAGIITDASEEEMNSLSAFSKAFGLLYQIVDDLLDYEGDQKIVGKDLRKDLDSGKASLVYVLGVTECKAFVEQLAKDAIAALDIFGEKAIFLRALTTYIINRRN